MAENIKVKVSNSSGGIRKKVTAITGQTLATVASGSKVKVGKLEDSFGNFDVGETGLQTGETLLYNSETKKWVATSMADNVTAVLSDESSNVVLSGGTF